MRGNQNNEKARERGYDSNLNEALKIYAIFIHIVDGGRR